MAENGQDVTRAVASLPGLDIEIVHNRPLDGGREEMLIALRATPSFEAFGRYLEAANPFLLWMRLMQEGLRFWSVLPDAEAMARVMGPGAKR